MLSRIMNLRVYDFFSRISILFVTSNHQTTNLVFPNFFPWIFLSLSSWKRKQVFSQTSKLRKIRGKNWRKLDWFFGGLMSRTRYSIENFYLVEPQNKENFVKKICTFRNRENMWWAWPCCAECWWQVGRHHTKPLPKRLIEIFANQKFPLVPHWDAQLWF